MALRQCMECVCGWPPFAWTGNRNGQFKTKFQNGVKYFIISYVCLYHHSNIDCICIRRKQNILRLLRLRSQIEQKQTIMTECLLIVAATFAPFVWMLPRAQLQRKTVNTVGRANNHNFDLWNCGRCSNKHRVFGCGAIFLSSHIEIKRIRCVIWRLARWGANQQVIWLTMMPFRPIICHYYGEYICLL